MIVITEKNVCHDNKIDVRVVSFSKMKTFLRTVDVFSYVARKIKERRSKKLTDIENSNECSII